MLIENQNFIYITNIRNINKILIIIVFLFNINILKRADEVLLMVLIETTAVYIRKIILYKTLDFKIK